MAVDTYRGIVRNQLSLNSFDRSDYGSAVLLWNVEREGREARSSSGHKGV
jgi:hypothetical protein